MIKQLYIIIRDFSRTLKDNNTTSFAAAAAFFMFLSIIPIVILTGSILQYTSISPEMIFTVGDSLLPHDIVAFIAEMAGEFSDRSVAAISVSALITLWLAGKGVQSLIYGLDAVHGFTEKRNFVTIRLRGSIYTFIFILLLIFSFTILVMGGSVQDMLIKQVPDLNIAVNFFLNFRFIFVWAFLVFVFQSVYTFLPGVKLKYREQFVGALFAAVCWSLLSWGYSLYIERFDGFAFYGSLTTVVMALVWLYLSMYVLFIGAAINVYTKSLVSLARQKK